VTDLIDTGDEVAHGPSGENWIVAGVDGDRLWWCGWPEGTVKLSDCTLIKKATPEERDELRARLAQLPYNDSRRRFGVAPAPPEFDSQWADRTPGASAPPQPPVVDAVPAEFDLDTSGLASLFDDHDAGRVARCDDAGDEDA
jgi:hypothetical protein